MDGASNGPEALARSRYFRQTLVLGYGPRRYDMRRWIKGLVAGVATALAGAVFGLTPAGAGLVSQFFIVGNEEYSLLQT